MGSAFNGTILNKLDADGEVADVSSNCEGCACIIFSEVVIDPNDPFPSGFRVADIC